jgi:bacillopeptidase F
MRRSGRRRTIPLALGGLLLTLSWAVATQAGVVDPRLEVALQALQPGEEIAAIVTLADQVDPEPYRGRGRGRFRTELVGALKAKAAATQQPLIALLGSRGVRRALSLWAINGIAVTAESEVLRELAELSAVRSVKLDATLDAPWTTKSTASIPEWNLETIRAPELWDLGHRGAGVVVASMDTGVDLDHPDLAPSWRGGTNSWFDPNAEHATPHDAGGHGTQTLGLMVGGNAGGSAIGVAPDAQWIAVKIFDDSGQATLSAIHQGFQWLLDPDGDPGTDDVPAVVNNSWGFPETVNQCYSEFELDIALLRAAGIAVVFSAGNRGPQASSSQSPANNPGAFAAGALDELLSIADTSSRGPNACDGSTYPEVAAPGVNVRTADLTFGGTFPDRYVSVTGTSFAAPHVSGGIALLLGAFPDATLDEVEQALEVAALDLGTSGPDDDYGYGLVDLVEAHAVLADSPSPTCTDADGDAYFAESGCGTLVDCNDADLGINPGACDIKRDGIDQDCDGVDRQRGKACPSAGDDGGSDGGTAEGKGKTCSDGLDNDGDALIDCFDPDCSRAKACR